MDGENEVQEGEVICQCVTGGAGSLNPCDLVPESRLLMTRPYNHTGTIRKKERTDKINIGGRITGNISGLSHPDLYSHVQLSPLVGLSHK